MIYVLYIVIISTIDNNRYISTNINKNSYLKICSQGLLSCIWEMWWCF